MQSEYRKLPAVDALLRSPDMALLASEYGAESVAQTVRALLAEARDAIAAGQPAPEPPVWAERAAEALAQAAQPSLRPVINATGIIVHTNLGRAPLSVAAAQAVSDSRHGLQQPGV